MPRFSTTLIRQDREVRVVRSEATITIDAATPEIARAIVQAMVKSDDEDVLHEIENLDWDEVSYEIVDGETIEEPRIDDTSETF